jgi:hypothetical protein
MPESVIGSVLYNCSKPRGGLAQLVERLLCTEKVSGSNPLASKVLKDAQRSVLCRSCINSGKPRNTTGIWGRSTRSLERSGGAHPSMLFDSKGPWLTN